MASEDAILTQRLECSLCFELMTEPKQLSCTHTFCVTCLNYLYQCRGRNKEISCPSCRQNTRIKDGDVSKLQTNFPIKAMVGDLQGARKNCTICDPEENTVAASYCQSCCDYLCETCLEIHGKYKKHSSHEIVDVDDIKRGKVKVKRFCHEHPLEEKLWVCTTCTSLICFRCRMLDHNDSNHKLEKVIDFQKQVKDNIESLRKKAAKKIKSLKRHAKLTKEQDTQIEMQVGEIIKDINQAYDDSIQRLTKAKHELIGQCKAVTYKLKMQLFDIHEASKKEIACITSASELISNGIKTILEGDTLSLHTALCAELEDMLSKNGSSELTVMGISKQAEDMEFNRYRWERELDLGYLMENTRYEFELERNNTYPLSRNSAYDMQPTSDGGMAVGYLGGGIEIFTKDGPQKIMMKDVEVWRFVFLTDARCVVLDENEDISVFTPLGKQLPVKYNTDTCIYEHLEGLCIDKYDKIYVGYCFEEKIKVFNSEGGAPIKEIPCHGYKSCHMRHMHHIPLLVLTDGSTVRVIDEEGTVKHDVTKEGHSARMSVLQDDNILIGWWKDELLSIDLYTPRLQYVRTVLANCKTNSDSYCLAEFSTGEIAFDDKQTLYIFRKS